MFTQLFNEKSDNRINQGALADCYFVSALSSLIGKPGAVDSLFITKEINKAGIYAVRIFLNGKPEIIVVDDFLPVRNGRPEFARGKDEFWMCILEKAWAKLHGSYAAIEAGQAEHVLLHLTNSPTTLTYHNHVKDKWAFWDRLKIAAEMNFPMTCGTPSKTISRTPMHGLISKHVYSILSIHEFEQFTLLKLRNPQGTNVWYGEWGPSSDMWSAGARAMLGYE